MPKIILKNASVLVGDDFLSADVIIDDGKIEQLVVEPLLRKKLSNSSSAYEVHDLSGMLLLPGFIDIHTHGGDGVDFNKAASGDFKKVRDFYVSRGVTSYLATVLTDTVEVLQGQLAALADEQTRRSCPEMIGVHLEGPFLSPNYRGVQPEEFLRDCDLQLFAQFQAAARGMIKLVTIAPELPSTLEFVKKLTADGVRVSIGHSGASYEQAMEAINAGVCSTTHIMNGMKLLHMHDPAVLTAILESDIYAEMICDGFHLHPPIIRLLLKTKGIDRMIAVTDSIMAAGLPDGFYTLGINEVEVINGDARHRVTKGRAGSTLTMDKALRNIEKFTALTLADVSKLLSANPAKMLGIFDQTGSIEVGKRADLVALDSNKNVVLTVARGTVVFRR